MSAPRIDTRAWRLPAFGIRAVMGRAFELERQGRELIHMEVGQPLDRTPDHIIDAAHRAALDGHTRYTPTLGVLPLREAVADELEAEGCTRPDPFDEVLIAPGAKHAIYMAIHALAEDGSEVLLPDCGFPPTELAVRTSNAKPVLYPTLHDEGFAIDFDGLEEVIGPAARLLVVNSPHNPSGHVMDRSDLERLADVALRHNLWLVSDEVYDTLLYDGREHVSPASLPELRDRTIVVRSASKRYAMTGWRLGWAVGPAVAIGTMRRVQEVTCTCATSFVQHAGVAALRDGAEFAADLRRRFQRNRDVLVAELGGIPGIQTKKPAGAMFCLVDVSELPLSAAELCERLLMEHGVVTVDGGSFGPGGQEHLRLSFASNPDEMREAAVRFARLVGEL